MTLPQLLLPILMAAATPAPSSPATTAPAATSPAVAAPEAPATPPPAKLEFPLAGYRINAFEELSKEAKASPWMGWGFSMVPHGDLISLPRVTAHVFVSSESKRTMAEYVKNEKAGHTHFGDSILSDQLLSATEWRVEYRSATDRLGGQIHAYERVLLANGQFYHASAIENESHWAKTGPALKAWVNSLETIAGPGANPPAASPDKLVFPQHGLRINALDAAPTSDKDKGTLMLAAGLSVTNQPYAKTLKDYQTATKTSQQNTQDKNAQYKIKVMAESFPADDTWVIEFTEEFPPDKVNHFVIQVHTYQKVILTHGRLYQAVASMANYEESDPAYFAKLKACVDSLEAIPAPEAAPATATAP